MPVPLASMPKTMHALDTKLLAKRPRRQDDVPILGRRKASPTRHTTPIKVRVLRTRAYTIIYALSYHVH